MSSPRERDIFSRALDLPSGERRAFVGRECGGDDQLRARVQALLDALDLAGEFLVSPTADPSTGTADSPAPQDSEPALEAGSLIGPYRVLQLIGEGGFGAVYMAQQERPVKRMVAVKIIKAGIHSRSVLARFEAERQAVALMDHPNIAHVFDAGETTDGRPYVTMELIYGVPITRYCDEQRLTPRERLELMVPVCHAIQHAHQKGIIHRDIKPNNVLVAIHDGAAMPKVIDFGIAKAITQPLTQAAPQTDVRSLVGTPGYMSPEQAGMTERDIDTRSDIYSLGVLMYELLTGCTPFDTKQLINCSIGEMQRTLREVDPPKPSTRVRTLGDRLSRVAEQRNTEPKRLSRIVRGDVDWIVMRAMEKDRARRYATANALAADIERHLRNEAVVAGPPSVAYKAAKFVQRNRVGVIAAAAVLLALMAGLAAAVVGFARAAHDRDQEAQANGEAQRQKRVAERLADQLRSRSDVLALSAAALATEAGDGPGARDALNNVEEARRGWEWNYLDAKTESALHTIDVPDGLVAWAVAKPPFVLIRCGTGNQWTVADTSTGRAVRHIASAEVGLSADGGSLLVRQADGSIDLEEIAGGEKRWVTAVLAPTGEQTHLHPWQATSPDGGEWALWQPGPEGKGEIAVFSMADGRRLRSVPYPSAVVDAPFYVTASDHSTRLVADREIDPVFGKPGSVPGNYNRQQYTGYARRHLLSSQAVEMHDVQRHRQVKVSCRDDLSYRDIDAERTWRIAATVDGRGAVRLWDMRQGLRGTRGGGDEAASEDESDDTVLVPMGRPLTSQVPFRSVRFSRDGRYLIAAGDHSLLVWSAAEMPPYLVGSLTDPRTAAAFSPDRGLVYSGGWGDVFCADSRTGYPKWRKNLGPGWVAGLALSNDAKRLASVQFDGASSELYLIDAASGEQIAAISRAPVTPDPVRGAAPAPWEGPPAWVAFSADDAFIHVGLANGKLVTLDAAKLAVVISWDEPPAFAAVRPSPSGKWLAAVVAKSAAIEAMGVHVLDSRTLTATRAIGLEEAAIDVAWSRDDALLAALTERNRVVLVEQYTAKVRWATTLPPQNPGCALTMTPDALRVVVFAAGGTLFVLDGNDGTVLVRLANEPDRAIAAACTPDGRSIVGVGYSFVIARLDAYRRGGDPEAVERGVVAAGWRLREEIFDRWMGGVSPIGIEAIDSRDAMPLEIRAATRTIAASLGHPINWSNSDVLQIIRGDGPADRLAFAERLARTNVALKPGSIGLWSNLGYVLRKRGSIEEALRCFETAEQLAAHQHIAPSTELLFGKARSLAELGRIAEARVVAGEIRRGMQGGSLDASSLDAIAELEQMLR